MYVQNTSNNIFNSFKKSTFFPHSEFTKNIWDTKPMFIFIVCSNRGAAWNIKLLHCSVIGNFDNYHSVNNNSGLPPIHWIINNPLLHLLPSTLCKYLLHLSQKVTRNKIHENVQIKQSIEKSYFYKKSRVYKLYLHMVCLYSFDVLSIYLIVSIVYI